MRILSYFLPSAPSRLVYMLQQVEYDSYKFADWADNAPNLSKVQHRQRLELTSRAKITLLVAYLLWGVPFLLGLGLFAFTLKPLWLLLIAFAPLFCVIGLFAFNGLFGTLIVRKVEAREIAVAANKLKSIKATKIAVLGSYGKTSMKEILLTILSEGLNSAATPGNKNVIISHARWVSNDLNGNEDALIFEYGEAEPGDIKALSSFSQPEIAVVTGLAPAHMDDYGTLDAIGQDFNDTGVKPENLFVNAESKELIARVKGVGYDHKNADGWAISSVKTSLQGLSFTMKKGKRTLKLQSGLIGKHNVGPLAAAAAIAARLGLSDKQIEAGVLKTLPFEHRLQPYELGGATIIDDTYNGNIEGMKAGLELLSELPAKRKIYVTPGLVEQGEESERIHKLLGAYISKAEPDKVVLMKNSTTDAIITGIHNGGYNGELVIENDPLDFYTNLQHVVAAGDLVLLQNDWPDSYS